MSRTKSTTVASTPEIAAAIAEKETDGIVKPGGHAKLLGSDMVGGRRRCTFQFRNGLSNFRKTVFKFYMPRKAGIEIAQVARAVAVPSILYSVETLSLSDTALNTARSVVSAAGNANTGGRQLDLALAIPDGANRTLDPAFEAHARRIKYWALADWENYIQIDLSV